MSDNVSQIFYLVLHENLLWNQGKFNQERMIIYSGCQLNTLIFQFCSVLMELLTFFFGNCILLTNLAAKPHMSNESSFFLIQVLESTDHINSCKPLSRTDPSYTETLEFLQKLKARYGQETSPHHFFFCSGIYYLYIPVIKENLQKILIYLMMLLPKRHAF